MEDLMVADLETGYLAYTLRNQVDHWHWQGWDLNGQSCFLTFLKSQ